MHLPCWAALGAHHTRVWCASCMDKNLIARGVLGSFIPFASLYRLLPRVAARRLHSPGAGAGAGTSPAATLPVAGLSSVLDCKFVCAAALRCLVCWC